MEKNTELIIIDDEETILVSLKDYLKRFGNYNIEIFKDPIEGMDYIKNHSPDVILLDLVFPNQNGIEILKKIKHYDDKIKVIVMTGHSTFDKVMKSFNFNADSYLMKPFEDFKTIHDKILECLNS